MLADSCHEIDTMAQNSEESKESESVMRQLLSGEDEQLVRKLFLESALLPILEAALRSGSILEMAKEFELYQVLLKLTKTISKKQALMDILNDIGADYQPRQKDSILKLLRKANDMSQRFKDCLSLGTNGESLDQVKAADTADMQSLQHEDPKKLSELFVDVYEHV